MEKKISLADAKQRLMEAGLKALGTPNVRRKANPCRIRFAGEFVRLLSGKDLWNSPGCAKSALLNHFVSVWQEDETLRYAKDLGGGWIPWEDLAKELYKQLLADGVLEIVEV